MAADFRLGADGPFRLGLNEVRIGLTLPWFAIVLARHRLTPAHFDHAAVTGEMFDPQTAREAGLLDAVVTPAELGDRAQSVARGAQFDRPFGARRHQVARPQPVLEELQRAVEAELAEAALTRRETGHPVPSDP